MEAARTTNLLNDAEGEGGGAPELARVHSVVLKLAAPCNLDCSYCYIYNHEDQSWRTRPRVIAQDTYDRVIAMLVEYCDRHRSTISVTFHGGEPTLIGVKRFDGMATQIRSELGERLAGLSMQTNGTLVDRAWAEALARHRVNAGVSLDGPAEIHDSARVDHGGRGSYSAAVRGLRNLQSAGLAPYTLAVIQPGASGATVYHHLRSLGIRWIDFLLPDVNHDNKEARFGGAGPTPVADYLLGVLAAWLAENDPSIRVRVFWDLFSSLLGGGADSDAFGNPPLSYVIIDTDGALEPLDAMRVCADGMTTTTHRAGVGALDAFVHESSFAGLLFERGMPLCGTCLGCPEVKVCGGGYLPHRYSSMGGFDNPSVWCEDIKRVLGAMRSVLDAYPSD